MLDELNPRCLDEDVDWLSYEADAPTRSDVHRRLARHRKLAQALVRIELPKVKPGTPEYENEVAIRAARLKRVDERRRELTQVEDSVDNILRDLVQMLIDAWNEADHPRGQPENAGQFGPGGFGGGESERTSTPAARPDIHQRLAARRSQAEKVMRAELPNVKPGTQRYEAEVTVRAARIMQAEERAAGRAAAPAAAQPTTAGAQKELFPGEFPPVAEKGDKPKPEDFQKAKIALAGELSDPDSGARKEIRRSVGERSQA